MTKEIRNEFERFLAVTKTGHKLFVLAGKPTHIAMTELQNFISTHRKVVQNQDTSFPLAFHGLRHTCATEWYQNWSERGKRARARLQVSNG